MSDPNLAAYEAALLSLLAEGLGPVERRAALRRRPAFAPYQRYVDQLDDRFLDLTAGLVRRWGRRAVSAPRPAARAAA